MATSPPIRCLDLAACPYGTDDELPCTCPEIVASARTQEVARRHRLAGRPREEARVCQAFELALAADCFSVPPGGAFSERQHAAWLEWLCALAAGEVAP